MAELQGETMVNRLKQALVESYVGAIALGYIFAQCVLHFVSIFASPVAAWVAYNQYGKLMPSTTAPEGFSPQTSLPDLIKFVLLLVLWIALMRWLYFEPLKNSTSDPVPNPE